MDGYKLTPGEWDAYVSNLPDEPYLTNDSTPMRCLEHSDQMQLRRLARMLS